MPREAIRIEVLSGTFDNQLDVFAHWLDVGSTRGIEVEAERLEVICKEDPLPRLRHYLPEATAHRITDLMALDTTVVLVLPGAVAEPVVQTDRLRGLGTWDGSRVVP
ncbi:MAG: hypothetical protein ACU0CI_09190 [Shimia sp.]